MIKLLNQFGISGGGNNRKFAKKLRNSKGQKLSKFQKLFQLRKKLLKNKNLSNFDIKKMSKIS